MSEKFTLSVWTNAGLPRTGASVSLVGSATYAGVELGTSGKYYWDSIPLGKYFLWVNGSDTGESFAVGDGEVAGLGYVNGTVIKSETDKLVLDALGISDITGLSTALSTIESDVSQLIIDVTNLEGVVATKATPSDISTAITTHVGLPDPHTQYRLESASVPWAELSGVPTTFTPSAHATSHAIGGSDPITEIGDITLTDGTTTITNSNVKITKTAGGLPLALETSSTDSSTNRSGLTIKRKTTVLASGDFGSNLLFLAEDSAGVEKAQGAIVLKRGGSLSNGSMTFQTAFGSVLQDSLFLDIDKTATFYGNVTVPNATANSHALNRITADGRYALSAHNQAWSTITTTPTTLAGYGISDAVKTTGDQAITGTLGIHHNLNNVTDDYAFVISPQGGSFATAGFGRYKLGTNYLGRAYVAEIDATTLNRLGSDGWIGKKAGSTNAELETSGKIHTKGIVDSAKVETSASTTTRAGVNLPHGTAPASPVNGDKWTTTAGEFTRVNGVTYETAVKSSLGNLQLISLGNTALGQNTTTNERGHLVRMVNGTGSASVKGTLISASTTTDNQFVLQANEFDAFGVVAESGIASGQECWIWVNGSTCEVLWTNSQSSTRGYLAICAPTDGRATNVAVPDSNPTVGEHFKEIGHVLQSKTAGTNVLVLCQIHFN